MQFSKIILLNFIIIQIIKNFNDFHLVIIFFNYCINDQL